MISPSTRFTLIVGAGASHAFGLPLGAGLRTILAKELDIRFDHFGSRLESGSYDIVEAIRLLVRQRDAGQGSINPHRQAAVQIAESMPFSSSIDEYVERHRDNSLKSECAKLGIGKAILDAERSSSLFPKDNGEKRSPIENATGSWIAAFLRDVTRGLTRSDIPSAMQQFSVINFNYDRCFEVFVLHWLQRVYEFSESEAWEIVSMIPIWHPYGTLGSLRTGSENEPIPFGAEPRPHRLLSIMHRIRTYSEAFDVGQDRDRAIQLLMGSGKLVFLGFGFHKQNMDLLELPKGSSRATFRCYATAKDLPNATWQICRERIRKSLNVANDGLFLESSPSTCEAFWNEFGETIIS